MKEFCLIVSLTLTQTPFMGEEMRCMCAGGLGRVKRCTRGFERCDASESSV